MCVNGGITFCSREESLTCSKPEKGEKVQVMQELHILNILTRKLKANTVKQRLTQTRHPNRLSHRPNRSRPDTRSTNPNRRAWGVFTPLSAGADSEQTG